MKIEQIQTVEIEVDTDALMAQYGVTGFSINAVNTLTEEGNGAEIVVNYDEDEPDDPCFITCHQYDDGCEIDDDGGADLSDAETRFFIHLAEIAVGMRGA